ncbi:hypothetical protein OEZ85_004638 [Tetradesmus obliquus]|uniref:Uncharacterized protein n=1 Tax=Tetradesmus obliquus TaxID=3088 RepID=A0ABY8URX8_TETOB|nr:hypothetical protein OEZ85_004638 [Tetradesmus obliquus]
MASWRRTFVVALGMCCFALQSQVQADESIVASFSDPLVKAWVQSAAVPTAATGISVSELPVARPGQGKPYSFCTLGSCATRVRVTNKDPLTNTTGMLYMDLRYKPIVGVNSTMMTWMFENMANNATYATTNETFPMYLIFHPRDHVVHEVQKVNGTVSRGAHLTWCEMILSNCIYNKNSAMEPWVCPPNAKGFIRSDKESSWAKKYKTKEKMVVNWFRSTGIEFSRIEASPLLGPKPRVVATTRHTWRDSAAGTALVGMRTQLWIGLMDINTTTKFNTSDFANSVNEFIKFQVMGGTSDLPTQNVTALGWMNALHFVEEYGGTKTWLPAVWRARKQASPEVG